MQTALDQANLLTGVRNDIECISKLPRPLQIMHINASLCQCIQVLGSRLTPCRTRPNRHIASHDRRDIGVRLSSPTTVIYLSTSPNRQAYETRSEFARQRTSLGSIQTRMTGVLSASCSLLFRPLSNHFPFVYLPYCPCGC